MIADGVQNFPAFLPSCQNFTIDIKVRFEGQTTFTTVRTDTCRLLCSNPNGEAASRYNFPFATQSNVEYLQVVSTPCSGTTSFVAYWEIMPY